MSGNRTRHFMKDKESKKLLEKASKKLKVNLEQILKEKTNVEVVQAESSELFLINGIPALAQMGEKIFPTLMFKEYLDLAPKATVDMGAVPYVCKGANIMAPGIRRFTGEFQAGDLIIIVDEKHGKPIALGETLYNAEEAKSVKQGIVIKNTHYVGDKIWNQLKTLTTAT